MMPGSSGSVVDCTVTYMSGIASVSCVDSTSSSGYQVILLQDSEPYSLTVVNIEPGEQHTLSVVPSGIYCIMELPMGNKFASEVKYSREFIVEEDVTTIRVVEVVNDVDVVGIISKSGVLHKSYTLLCHYY